VTTRSGLGFNLNTLEIPPPNIMSTVTVPDCLPTPRPDHRSTRRPSSKLGVFLWRRRMWFESTFVLSMLEPWEKFLMCSLSSLKVNSVRADHPPLSSNDIHHPLRPRRHGPIQVPPPSPRHHAREGDVLPVGPRGRRADPVAVAWPCFWGHGQRPLCRWIVGGVVTCGLAGECFL
jgi:hypothetical protein